jgi:hypothetical protein
MSVLSAKSILLVSVFSLFLVKQPAAQNTQIGTADRLGNRFCGDSPCFVNFPVPCAQIAEELIWQGTYCQLTDVPEALSCRLTVKDGQCAYSPRCDDGDAKGTYCPSTYQCYTILESDNNEDLVLFDDYNVLLKPSAAPSAVGDVPEPTVAPTGSPPFPCPTTYIAPPPSSPNNGEDDDDAASSYGTAFTTILLASSAIAAFFSL